MKLIGIIRSCFSPLWQPYDKVLPMEGKILQTMQTNSFTVSAEFRAPSWWHFLFMRQMIWIIGPSACNVSTLGHCWDLYSVSGPVAAIPPVAPAFQWGWRALEPPGSNQRAAVSTWNSMTMTHSGENLPTGELGPSQPEKQVSVCQITSFRSAAFRQKGKREHTLGLVRKSSSLTVSLKALHFLCCNLYLLQVDSIW